MSRPALLLVLALVARAAPAQDPASSGWKLPPPEVVALVDAPAPPGVDASPDGRWLLVVERPSLPTLAEMARPWIPLAGVRLDPAADGRWRSGYDSGLVLVPLGGGDERRVALPDGARVGDTSWSPTSERLAFTLVTDGGTELWVAGVADARPVRVLARLNAVLGRGFTWMPDGRRLLVHAVPEGRGPAPERPRVPGGPRVQETDGDLSPVRTYQDLLHDAHDERLFEHHAASQLAIVDPEGERVDVGAPALIASSDPSPDARHLLVETLHRPFSYVLPFWDFPRRIEVWSAEGEPEHLLADLPLAENVPIGGVREGPRDVQWRAGQPATLVWVRALDEGRPKRQVPHRDQWLALPAPFEAPPGGPEELARVEHRATGIRWLEDPELVLLSEYDRDRHWTRTTLVHVHDPDAEVRMLDDRSVRDGYGDPGSIVTRTTERGERVVRQDGPWIYRVGRGATPQGERPFVARTSLESLAAEELWRAIPGTYEQVDGVLETSLEGAPVVLTRFETPDDPPSWRVRDLERKTTRTVAEFPHPHPELSGIQKELLTYRREDGVQLSATLYLPSGHQPGERLPLLVWAYPLEYTDPDVAGQVDGSPFRFTRLGGTSHLLLLTQGYAVLDGAAMPIVGDPETVNDTFVAQLEASARAAIDAVVERGVADPERVAVGGHSYGAFMTANLLAHTRLFRAGIARSGAYNRTLTPFGFQAERRTLWEATDTYVAVSPFLHADRIAAPLLLIHGADDPNSGTFPLQSERMFHAIKGNGGRARHVELPYEGHGYRARESVLHVLAEMIDWLDTHVRPGVGAPDPAAGSGAGVPSAVPAAAPDTGDDAESAL